MPIEPTAFVRAIRWVCAAMAIALAVGPAPLAIAAETNLPPIRLQTVYPAGGQRGTTLETEISGRFFEGLTGLHFSDPAITAEMIPAQPAADAEPETPGPDGPGGRKPRQQRFRVTIGPDVKAGIYEARALGAHGVSSPHAFVVGTRPEKTEVEPNNASDQATEIAVDSVVDGRMDSPIDVDYFRFSAQAGQRLILDLSAHRIDSPLDAVVTLYGPNGDEIDRAHDNLHRDALLDFTAPSEGQYLVAVRDLTYAGSSRHFYRLALGTAPHIDFVFPPSGVAGSQDRYRVFGRNLPGGQPVAGLSVDRRPLEMLEITIPLPADPATQQIAGGSLMGAASAGVDSVEFQLDSPLGPSNSVAVCLAGAPVVAEQEPNNDPAHAQRVTFPCELVGQFYSQGDRDWFTFDAKQGEVYWMEVCCQRLGLPADPVLVIQRVTKDAAGAEVVTDVQVGDDDAANPGEDLFPTASDDPAFVFTAPADGSYRMMLGDLAGSERSDPRVVYRLTIRPPQPDFRLVAVPRSLPSDVDPKKAAPAIHSSNVRRGGTDVIQVIALRRHGFDGEISVNVAGLPPGATASPITIGPGQSSGSLVLLGTPEAPDGASAVTITGSARIGDVDVVRTARLGTMVSAGVFNQIHPRSRLARDLVVGVIGSETALVALEVEPTPLAQARPGTVSIPVNVVRRGDFKGAVTLLTFAGPPGANVVENVTVPPDESSGNVELKLGKNTPPGKFSFFVVGIAELPANPERRRPGAAKIGIASPALNLTVAATTIGLAVKPPAEPARQGAAIELPITLERLYGYNETVQVRLKAPDGVEGIQAGVLTIPRGKSDGTFPVTLTPTATLGVHKLVVTAIARIGGQELPVTQEIELNVQPGEAAPAQQ